MTDTNKRPVSPVNGIIVPIEMPRTCGECIFRTVPERFGIKDHPGWFEMISKCRFAPDRVKDPWRSLVWQSEFKEKWCPLRECGQRG